MLEVVDEVHRVVLVGGMWMACDAMMLIARSESHVLSWRLARTETSTS